MHLLDQVLEAEPSRSRRPAVVPISGSQIGHFHAFSHQDGFHVIDVDGMAVHEVDEPTYELLKSLQGARGIAVSPDVAPILEPLGLLHRGTHAETRGGKPIPVRSVALFLTQECNLRCTYCYGDGGSYGGGGMMEDHTAQRTIDWLIGQSEDEKKLGIIFFGGEPFLNFPLMKHVVAYAKEKGELAGKEFTFSVTTNGTLLNDERIAFLKEHNVSVIVSMDGPKELNDRQRPNANGKGSFDQTVPKVKKLLKILPNTPVRATLVGDVEPSYVEEGLKDIGFKRVTLTAASKSTFANGVNQQKGGFGQLFDRVGAKATEFLELTRARDSEKLNELKNSGAGRTLFKMVEQFLNHQKREFLCGAGRYYVGVSVSGDVYPCHRLVGSSGQKLGDVGTGALERSAFQESASKWHPDCSNCFAKNVCGGGCYHDNLGATGSAFGPDEQMCNLIRESVEQAARVVPKLTKEDIDFLAVSKMITRNCPFDLF